MQHEDDMKNGNDKAAKIAVMDFGRDELRKHEDRIKDILNFSAELRVLLKKSESFKEFGAILDSTQLCLVYDLDISTLTFQMISARTEWARNLNARLLAMTMWECVDDLPTISGKTFRLAVSNLTIPDRLMDRLNETLKGLNRFKQQHEQALKKIRHFAAAHRDLDIDKLMEVLTQIDPRFLFTLSKQLTQSLGTFTSTMVAVFKEANQLLSLAKLISDQKKC